MTCRPKHLKQKAGERRAERSCLSFLILCADILTRRCWGGSLPDDARAFAKLKKQASSDQTTILQFFGVSSRSPARTFGELCPAVQSPRPSLSNPLRLLLGRTFPMHACTDPTVSPGSKRGRRGRRRCSYNPKANRQVFRAPVPSTDVSRRVDQLASVTAAMQAKGIKYTDQLCYSPSASSSMNIASREVQCRCTTACCGHRQLMRCGCGQIGGLQKMTKVNMAVFRKFKEMTAEGLFAPMVVSNDPVQGCVCWPSACWWLGLLASVFVPLLPSSSRAGPALSSFVVRADARILDRTLLCEYVGDVHLLKDKLHGECDSLMELLRTGDPTTTLLISPKYVACGPADTPRGVVGLNGCACPYGMVVTLQAHCQHRPLPQRHQQPHC